MWPLARRRERAERRRADPAELPRETARPAGDEGNSLPSPNEREPDREELLVAQLARGDESALREIYRAHRPALLRFARRLVGDAAAADDLVHEVFVRLPRAIRRLKPGTSLGGFLIAVALNNARHHVRAAARRRQAQVRLAREPLPTGDGPDEALARRQLAEALARGLDRLPMDQRIAFVLCAVEERSSAEAAALAGTNESTMRARLLLARRKLRVFLAGHHDGDGGIS